MATRLAGSEVLLRAVSTQQTCARTCRKVLKIRRAALRIDKVLSGRQAEIVSFGQPHLQHFGQHLSGEQIEWVSSRGKAMLTRFANGLTLYSHNQLYGRWYVVRRNQLPRTHRTLRVAIHTKTHSALLYSASDIEVLTPEQLPMQKYLARLGPDALDESVHWRDVLELLNAPQFHRRTWRRCTWIKVSLRALAITCVRKFYMKPGSIRLTDPVTCRAGNWAVLLGRLWS